MRLRNRSLITCLLGLAAAASLACALPAPADDAGEAPQWGIDPVETPTVAPWTPSEEWLELYERDQAIQALKEAGEMDEYYRQRQEFEDWIVQHPDADIPCETLYRYGPQEMRDNCIDPRLNPTRKKVRTMEKTQKSLTPIDQLALRVIVDHLEPHDCQWNLYGEAAQSVVDAVKTPIEIQAMQQWAADLESYLDDRGETYFKLRPADLRARIAQLEAEHQAQGDAPRPTQDDPWAQSNG